MGSENRLRRESVDELGSQDEDISELMLTHSEGLPPGVADYLGDLTAVLDLEAGTIKCHVYRSHKH